MARKVMFLRAFYYVLRVWLVLAYSSTLKISVVFVILNLTCPEQGRGIQDLGGTVTPVTVPRFRIESGMTPVTVIR